MSKGLPRTAHLQPGSESVIATNHELQAEQITNFLQNNKSGNQFCQKIVHIEPLSQGLCTHSRAELVTYVGILPNAWYDWRG